MVCKESIPSNPITLANHYSSHQSNLTHTQLDLERAETEASSLRTRLQLAIGDRSQAERERDSINQELDSARAEVEALRAQLGSLRQQPDKARAQATPSQKKKLLYCNRCLRCLQRMTANVSSHSPFPLSSTLFFSSDPSPF